MQNLQIWRATVFVLTGHKNVIISANPHYQICYILYLPFQFYLHIQALLHFITVGLLPTFLGCTTPDKLFLSHGNFSGVYYFHFVLGSVMVSILPGLQKEEQEVVEKRRSQVLKGLEKLSTKANEMSNGELGGPRIAPFAPGLGPSSVRISRRGGGREYRLTWPEK